MARAEQERRWQGAKTKRAAVQLCLAQGYFSESITRSYDTCYQGMWIAVGDPPVGLWRHGGLINECCRGRWQQPPAMPQTFTLLRKKLDRLYVHRIQSDYDARCLSREEAQEALDTVEEVLRLVAQHTGLRF